MHVFRSSPPAAALAPGLISGVVCLLSALPLAPAQAAAAPSAEAADTVPPFREAAVASGLDFTHFNGMSGKYFFPEMLGPGVALLDYDGDGDLDVYVVQGTQIDPSEDPAPPLFPLAAGTPPSDRLFRNDLAAGPDGEPRLHFTDVTASAGLPAGGYGMGVASGDFDNDGRPDLYVTNFGSNRLLRNVGDGSFADVTESAGADDSRWSTSAAFVDYDRDGWLDLYVVNYIDFPLADNPPCFATSSRRDYCGPASFPPTPDRLLHNRGDGTFENATVAAGVAAAAGPGLGVVITDADGDGWPDVYVANDGAANFLWHNRGDGTFEDQALLAGAAVNGRGQAEAGMGVDADDFDNDGDEDIFLAHLKTESNTLYVNDGGNYTDRTSAAGLAAPSLGLTGFGAAWIDYDNDTWLDLVVGNGAERIIESLAEAGDPFPLDMPNQLFHNRGDGTFVEVSDQVGPPFTDLEVSRGTAVGDVDNDGDADVVIVNTTGPLRLFLNTVDGARPWLGLRLVDGSGRDALGARVEVVRPDAPSLWRRAATDGSFLAAHDPRVLVGLGDGPAPEALQVRWPDGRVERFPAPPLGRYTTLEEGSAPAPDAPLTADDQNVGEPSNAADSADDTSSATTADGDSP